MLTISPITVAQPSAAFIASMQAYEAETATDRLWSSLSRQARHFLEQAPIQTIAPFSYEMMRQQASIIPAPHEADQMSAAEYRARYIDSPTPDAV